MCTINSATVHFRLNKIKKNSNRCNSKTKWKRIFNVLLKFYLNALPSVNGDLNLGYKGISNGLLVLAGDY